MTSQFVILSVMLLITCAAARCVRDGYTVPTYNFRGYPKVKCTNMTIANLGEQVRKFIGSFLLSLKNIEFTDLTNIRNFPYRSVEHLIIHHNAQDIGELVFSSFSYLRSLEIYDCKFSNNLLKGFQTTSDNWFIQLKMSRNNINRISALCDKSRYLETVYLSENNLTDIGINSFLECSNLLYLNLSYNAIQRIEPESFSDLTKLETLDLTANRLSTISANTFTELSRLGSLVLTNSCISHMESGAFNGLYNLHSLVLSYNNITVLQTDTFIGLAKLETLDLTANRLSTISPGAFNGLNVIQNLDFSTFRLTTVKANTFTGLANVRTLDFTNLSIVSMESGAFNGLYNLQSLILSHNNITELETETFNQTSRLTHLELSHNKIERIAPGAFKGLSELEDLDFTPFILTTIEANTFTGLTNVRTLDLTNLSISTMEPGAFNGLYNLQSLILSNNNITEVQTDTFNQTKLLTKLDLTRNKIERIAPGAFNSLDKLESLDISYNELKHLHCETSDHYLSDMRSLNLSNNKISTIDVCAFSRFEKLTLLDLSYNTMTKVLRGTFSPLAELKQLNMSNNRLAHLEPAIMFPLLELRRLDVSGNLLQDWDANSVVCRLHHLTHLDFSANKWDCNYLMQVLQYLAEKHVSIRSNYEPVYHVGNVNGIHCANLGMQINQSEDAANNGFGPQTLSNENKTDAQFKLGLKELNELKFNEKIKILNASQSQKTNENPDYYKINQVSLTNKNQTGHGELMDLLGLQFTEIIKILKANKNSHETISMDEKVNNIKNMTDNRLMYVTDNLRILYIMLILMFISLSIFFCYRIIKLYLKTRGTCATRRVSDSGPATSQLLDTYNI